MASMQLERTPQIAAIVSLSNKTSSNMAYLSSHNWSGSISGGSYPSPINANTDESFIHLKGDEGSIAGVHYAGLDAAGKDYSVIIAWDAPPEFDQFTSPNKVYVMSGPRSVVDPLSWSEIEILLKNASSSAYSYGVEATIHSGSSSTALVAATIKFA